MADVNAPARIDGLGHHAPLALLRKHFGNLDGALQMLLGFAMGKRNMERLVFEVIEEIARPDIGFDPEIQPLEIGDSAATAVAPLPEISEYHAQILFRWMARDADVLRERFLFRRLFDALP